MEEIEISQFKAKCLSVLDRVRRTRKPVRVTRYGRPVAEVVPPSSCGKKHDWIGAMQGTGQIHGDIVAPAADERDWEALEQ